MNVNVLVNVDVHENERATLLEVGFGAVVPDCPGFAAGANFVVYVHVYEHVHVHVKLREPR